jgi:hypothetical protein
MSKILWASLGLISFSVASLLFISGNTVVYAASPKCFSETISGTIEEFPTLCTIPLEGVAETGYDITGLPNPLQEDRCYFWASDPTSPGVDVTDQCASPPYSNAPQFGSTTPPPPSLPEAVNELTKDDDETTNLNDAFLTDCEGLTGDARDECTTRDDVVNCNGSGNDPAKLKACLEKNPLVTTTQLIINTLGIGVAVIVTIVVISGGIQYATAGANPQAVGAAKGKIINAILALLMYVLIYSFIQFLVPGGIF